MSPPFYISGWPGSVGEVTVRIRRPGFYFRIRPLNNKLFKLARRLCTGLHGFKFNIMRDGTIRIELFDRRYFSRDYSDKIIGSYHTDTDDRANALFLFNMLKDTALPAIVRKVERDTRYNQEVVDAVKEALRPFVPQIVADELTK